MKNPFLKVVLLCAFFMFFSCEKDKTLPQFISQIEPDISGVVLSFDDDYINEWFTTNQNLKQYSWKASFCISKINALKPSEIRKLQQLQSEGNEIAGHSFHHYNANDFVNTHSVEEYIKQEINPMMDLMNFYGLQVTSYVYPYGSRSKKLDKALLPIFNIVRGRAFCEEEPSKQGCYYNNSRLVFSFSIDDTHNHFNIYHLLELLEYAKKNNKIIILNSHKTIKEVTDDYQTKEETLEIVCKYINQNNMKFYTLSDLAKKTSSFPFQK